MRHRPYLIGALLGGLALAGAARMQSGQPAYTTNFRLQDALLIPSGSNPYFTLTPGKFWRYEGDDGGEFVQLEIRVLPQTKWVSFPINGQTKWALTRVVEEREWADGKLVEVSRNFFARDLATRNMFYFGEEVDVYQNGVIVSHDGAWLAGVNGAKPGLFMPALNLVGSRYFQEIAPGVAMDRVEHAEMGLQVTTPAGTFFNCFVVRETTPLEPGAEGFKTYAPKVGMIKDGFLELVEYN